jgi:signal transduction histidine kinase
MDNITRKLDLYEFLMDFVSHEIRNPLNSIIMFSNLMTEGAYGDLTEEQREIVNRVLVSAYRIEHMTGDFLNMRRVDAKEELLHREWLSLKRDIVLVTLSDLKDKFPHLAERLAKVQEGDCSAGKIFADRQLLLTLYDNLFFNALKYGSEKGRISWDCLMEGDHWLMRVYNEGKGVRKEELDNIFSKFVRIKDKEIPEQAGTGLGLYNVQRIVQLHGGRIWAESEYGRNFAVWMTIPRPSPA